MDVAPEALWQAGGEVVRFGMPVDPGNLLFLGQIERKPVIGLPGCARSPALNGADWVLQRVGCGVEVVGGLEHADMFFDQEEIALENRMHEICPWLRMMAYHCRRGVDVNRVL